MSIFDPDDVITVYTQQEAIEDGVLVEIFKNRWDELSGGKPIVATRHLFEEVSLAGLREIWNEFAYWKKDIEKTRPEEEKLFHTKMNGLTVWVIEDGAAFTLMYPEDY
jgi:type I site-specific restriction endonuclease